MTMPRDPRAVCGLVDRYFGGIDCRVNTANLPQRSEDRRFGNGSLTDFSKLVCNSLRYGAEMLFFNEQAYIAYRYYRFPAFTQRRGTWLVAARRPEALARWEASLAEPIDTQKYVQYQFFKQWSELKAYCHERGIQMMGDIPIFVAHDSADVWAQPELFHLDADGNPSVQAGVPPDYFSATGQLWGNPLYRWDVMAETGYAWWIDRFRSTLRLVDIVRLDHFRGFEAYWEIPGKEKTAIKGRWVKAPGAELFEAVQKTLADLPIVAETLGVITPEVEALRDRFGFPGMGILQFAFGTDPQAPDFKPHNYSRHFVVYTGTHDNDTTIGWWTSSGVGDSTRTAENIRAEREFALKYLGTDGREMNWVLIRAILASVADWRSFHSRTSWVWAAKRG